MVHYGTCASTVTCHSVLIVFFTVFMLTKCIITNVDLNPAIKILRKFQRMHFDRNLILLLSYHFICNCIDSWWTLARAKNTILCFTFQRSCSKCMKKVQYCTEGCRVLGRWEPFGWGEMSPYLVTEFDICLIFSFIFVFNWIIIFDIIFWNIKLTINNNKRWIMGCRCELMV